ncbi:MAG: hypothetical protein ACQEWM_09200 [Actinomycetota bacterium]
MSQHDGPAGPHPSTPAPQPVPAYPGSQPSQQPPSYQAASAPAGYQPASPAGYQPSPHVAAGGPTPPAPKTRNTIGLIALIVAVVGFIFACIPGALIVGWVLLPVAFILSIVSFFQRGKGKGLGIAALIVSVVGTIVGAIVFFAVVASSFEQAFSEGSTVVSEPADDPASDGAAAPADDAAEEPAAAPEAAAGDEGSRESPLAVGSTISNDEWTVTVDAFNADGNAVVAAGQFNEAPPAGSHYEIVTYTVTYTGEDSSFAAMVGVDMVTSAGNVINSYDNLVILDDSIGADELFSGASATGSAAFLVPDGETPLLRVRPGMFGDEVFVQP